MHAIFPQGWNDDESDDPRRPNVRVAWGEKTIADWIAWANGIEGLWDRKGTTELRGYVDPRRLNVRVIVAWLIVAALTAVGLMLLCWAIWRLLQGG